MAIHISEIGVRLVVGAAPAPAQSGGRGGPGPSGGGASNSTAISPDRMDELVSSCTQRVLETLRALEER